MTQGPHQHHTAQNSQSHAPFTEHDKPAQTDAPQAPNKPTHRREAMFKITKQDVFTLLFALAFVGLHQAYAASVINVNGPIALMCGIVESLRSPALVFAAVLVAVAWGAWSYFTGGRVMDNVIRMVVFIGVVFGARGIASLMVEGGTACATPK